MFELASEANRTKSARSAGQLKALGDLLGLLQQEPVAYFQSPTRYSAVGMEQGGRPALDAEAIQARIDARAAAKRARLRRSRPYPRRAARCRNRTRRQARRRDAVAPGLMSRQE